MNATTPDGKYFVVRGRLWRCANPALDDEVRQRLVNELMQARRNIRDAIRSQEHVLIGRARRVVQAAKVALGERGPVWWNDGAPDYNRHMAVNTPYRDWFLSLPDSQSRSATRARSLPLG